MQDGGYLVRSWKNEAMPTQKLCLKTKKNNISLVYDQNKLIIERERKTFSI